LMTVLVLVCYQGPTTSRENAILKYLNFHHTFFLNLY
jgi:hypothetical protein